MEIVVVCLFLFFVGWCGVLYVSCGGGVVWFLEGVEEVW